MLMRFAVEALQRWLGWDRGGSVHAGRLDALDAVCESRAALEASGQLTEFRGYAAVVAALPALAVLHGADLPAGVLEQRAPTDDPHHHATRVHRGGW